MPKKNRSHGDRQNGSALFRREIVEVIRFLAPGETPAWQRLAAPLRYLAIHHEIKPRFDWGWPGILTALTMLGFWLLPVTPHILGDDGFLKGVRELIALFAAFFVVALAAVATFSRPTLDMPMEGTSPTLNGRTLNRRQFVCYLFGYLAVLSFALFLAAVLAEIVAPSLRAELSSNALWWVKVVSGTVFTFWFWNMVVTTLLGVYFLVERVHIEPQADDAPREGGEFHDNRLRRGNRAA
jgi:hypothetical protein